MQGNLCFCNPKVTNIEDFQSIETAKDLLSLGLRKFYEEEKLGLAPVAAYVLELFQISDLVDSRTGKLKNEAMAFNIYSKEEWEATLSEKMRWIFEHREEVLLNIKSLRDSWPQCCLALEKLLV